MYKDYRGNFIIGAEILERVKKLKVELWRLPNERSEDALRSWNVFMGLSRSGGLGVAFHRLTGIKVDIEPKLYLWGVKVFLTTRHVLGRSWKKSATPWRIDRVCQRSQTLFYGVPEKAIALIEAKFGSPNSTLKRHDDRFGTISTFLNRYPCLERAADLLPNRRWIEQQPPGGVLQQ